LQVAHAKGDNPDAMDVLNEEKRNPKVNVLKMTNKSNYYWTNYGKYAIAT